MFKLPVLFMLQVHFIDINVSQNVKYSTHGNIKSKMVILFHWQSGEVWQEINRELSLEGVRPISSDQEALSAIINVMEDTAKRVTREQISIMEQYEKEELSQEENMYTEVLSHAEQGEESSVMIDHVYLSCTE